MRRIWLPLITLLLFCATAHAQEPFKGSLFNATPDVSPTPIQVASVNEKFTKALAREAFHNPLYAQISSAYSRATFKYTTAPFTCDSAHEGWYYANTTTHTFNYCNGTAWSTSGAVSLPASASQGDLLYGSAANTYSNLAKDTNATRYLANTGTSNNPAWAQVNLGNGVTGSLPETSLSFTDVTTNNASITVHGFLPKLPNDATKYLNGLGAWATVSAGVTCSGCTTNTLPKTTGAGALGNSRITDDGTALDIASGAISIISGETDVTQASGVVVLGDTQSNGNQTTLRIDDTLQLLTFNKAVQLQSLTSNGFVKTGGGNGALSVDTNTYTPSIVCSNTAASTAITGTASKTYFNINCSIPANTLVAGKTITLDARGVYSAAAANTIVQTVDLCKVSGCGSGTVVNLATTSAATPGLVTSQGWLLNENHVVYTAGGTGTMDTQGYAAYQTAALVITFDPTQNTSTATIDTTAQQYLSIAVTWSSNSGSNTITLRNFKVVIQ